MHVGVIGLGRMGSVFAERLLKRAFDVLVWNRSLSKADSLIAQGADYASTAKELVNRRDVIIVSLADEKALESVYFGADGILSASLAGKVVVETSTVRPLFVQKLAQSVKEREGRLLDAPVLGTVGPAREGKLVFVVGGDSNALEQANLPLALLSRRIIHMGPNGTGSTMKLVVNMLLSVYWQSLAEAVAMGESNGLDFEAMLDVLIDSPVATPALHVKRSLLRGEKANVDFDIAGVQKDLAAALSTASSYTGTAESALKAYDLAANSGYGREDVTAIISFARRAGPL